MPNNSGQAMHSKCKRNFAYQASHCENSHGNSKTGKKHHWLGPRILPDVDLVLISNTIALEGGLNVLTDSIFHEEADTALRATVNIIVVKEERAEEEELQVLGELYHDPEVQAFIEEKFDGTKVQVQTPIEEIWGN